MKRIVSLLFICLLCTVLAVPCFAEEFANPPIDDGAGYLSETLFEQLSAKIEGIRQKYNFDVAIVTEVEMSGSDAMSSAKNIYNSFGYGAGEKNDGILLYICSDAREYWIIPMAYGHEVFNERGVEYLKKNINAELKNDNYYDAMDTFADLADELLEMAANGKPYNKRQISTTYLIIVIGCAVLIPLILAWILTSIRLSKMKTAVSNDYAANYVKQGSKRLDFSRDLFLYSNITKTERPKSNSGSQKSSGQNGGGGSF